MTTYPSDIRTAEVLASDVPTGKLAEFALTLGTRDMYSELWGRDSAWYAIGHTRDAATEFLATLPPVRLREVSAHALGLAGYGPADLP